MSDLPTTGNNTGRGNGSGVVQSVGICPNSSTRMPLRDWHPIVRVPAHRDHRFHGIVITDSTAS
jgi:hypothetical protein